MTIDKVNINVFATPVSHYMIEHKFTLNNIFKKRLAIFRTPNDM